MPMLVLAAVLAVGTAVADDEPTYTLTVDVGGV